MTRSLDFTACTKQDCPVKDCFRKLTKEELDWLEKTPNRMAWADVWKNCEKLKLEIAKQSISTALSYLACMDRISDKECNEQLAFDVLRKALEELEND